jgi:hypothetical protein
LGLTLSVTVYIAVKYTYERQGVKNLYTRLIHWIQQHYKVSKEANLNECLADSELGPLAINHIVSKKP